jgi:hypothetical protein
MIVRQPVYCCIVGRRLCVQLVNRNAERRDFPCAYKRLIVHFNNAEHDGMFGGQLQLYRYVTRT